MGAEQGQSGTPSTPASVDLVRGALADTWTPRQAAQLLDPAMNVREIRNMIVLFRIRARGIHKPSPPNNGRPSRVYDPEDLLTAHALVMRARQKFNGP